ncbi:MAG TPA: site-specific DNA-methyltransferase, partial [Prosthecobacter sp.]|nr:site-specific DNA-methyltransferase [Prosthecobacter sp.]
AGQVKCIYIDPPYNTGNEGWVYNDNVRSPIIEEWLGKTVGKEGETLDRHDRWLCMMYPRLALLREFLREDGSIWISLDDNEIQALRYVMDEIFGAGNFVTTVLWQKNFAPKNSAKHFSEDHDYVVVYAKKAESWRPNLLQRSDEALARYKNPDNDPRGVWTSGDLQARNYYGDGTYSITCPSGRVIAGPGKGMYWRYSEANFLELDRKGQIWWGEKGDNMPRLKRYLRDVKDGVTPQTMWFHKDVGHTQEAKKELLEAVLFDTSDDVFITPKPTRLIERILQIATNPGNLVLDSFGGSGTTGHAVLKLNAANPSTTESTEKHRDSDSETLWSSVPSVVETVPDRRFILVEMEPEIAPKITAERVKRVAQGYTNAKGEAVPGLGGGFRYCRLGEPLFDADRQIRESVTFGELARHVYFTETGEPLPRERVPNTPLLGVCRGVAIYLLYNGILGDKSTNGGNVLTRGILAKLPKYDGQKVIYCAGCLLGKERQNAERIVIRQTPYEIKIS